MNRIYRSIIILLLIGISACVATQSNVIASNDEDKDIGLGGTGVMANTGSGLGGTGIVGEITGFGSIFVNGIEVEYDKKTTFSIDGKKAPYQQLEIGDIVEILTVDSKKHTQALMINVRHEIIGKVESINSKALSFKVNGQTVIQAIKNGKLPDIGTTVAVSGFRIDKKMILSTRVVPTDSKRSLLRTHIELPFKGKTARWSVQTHVSKGKVNFGLGDSTHSIVVTGKSDKSVSGQLGIRILELQKTRSGKLQLQKEIEPDKVPRGRPVETPTHLPGKNMQGPNTGPGPMHMQPKKPMGNIFGFKKTV